MINDIMRYSDINYFGVSIDINMQIFDSSIPPHCEIIDSLVLSTKSIWHIIRFSYFVIVAIALSLILRVLNFSVRFVL